MKKTAAILVITGVAVAVAGCASSAPADTANGPEWTVKPGALTACIDPEYAPLEYYENGSDGNIIGFDADGFRALAEHLNLTPEMNVVAFDGLMPQLQASACDLIFGGLYMTDERLAVADASGVMKAGPAILASPDKVGSITSTDDLCGLTVAAQAASSNAASITALSDTCTQDGNDPITVTEYPKTAETVLAVINGKADALVETNVAAAYMVSQNEGTLAVAPDIFPLDTTFGVFTRKGDGASQAVADGLAALRADGTLAQIATDYGLDPAITEVG